jgi:Flp pilus assembly protein TadG
VIDRLRSHLRRGVERGQSLVEMGMLLPLLVLIVIGTLEFGFVFDHHLTLEYATREGARAGAALAHGGSGPPGCAGAADVDPRIVAAVQRVLTSPGSPITVANVSEIHIYNAGPDGEEGATNVWRHSAGMGPVVDGVALNFVQQSVAWPACGRNNTAVGTQSVGVSLTYTYTYQTPFRFLFGNGLTMTDRTVMQLNPTN